MLRRIVQDRLQKVNNNRSLYSFPFFIFSFERFVNPLVSYSFSAILIVYRTKGAWEEYAKPSATATPSVDVCKFAKTACAKSGVEAIPCALIPKLASTNNAKVNNWSENRLYRMEQTTIIFEIFIRTDPCQEASTCGTCSLCRVVNHGIQCSCPVDFVGNALIGCNKAPIKCQGRECECDEAGYCTKTCSRSSDCDCGEICVNNKCRSKCGGPNSCPQVTISTLDISVKEKGGKKFIHFSLFFVKGQICSGGACVVGCRTDHDCSSDKACRNKRCRDPCSGSEFPCGTNAVCKVSDHRALCFCPDGFRGEPTRSCQPYECDKDEDCEANKFCGIDKACKNPCLEPGACGVNSQCRVVSRRKQCSCPPGLVGNPEIECRPGKYFGS